VAAAQATDLLAGLRVHADRMRAHHDAAAEDLHAEQRSMAGLAGRPPAAHYLGVSSGLVGAAVARARRHLDHHPADHPADHPDDHPDDHLEENR
jgi:3-carboxy-cis,cis-muconate cycloisomerase